MSIITNKNTTQTPLASGKTGAQVVKFIAGPRVYIKTAESLTAAPVQNYYTKSNGSTPTGWTDLGIVIGNATVTYEKQTTEVRTGIDNVLRQEFVNQKNGTIEFNLGQLDDVALENISGLTASVIVSGSTVAYRVGEEDLTEKALLLVAQNKLDGKEIQFYNPRAMINFAIVENDNALVLRVTGKLPTFTPQGASVESLLHTTIFA